MESSDASSNRLSSYRSRKRRSSRDSDSSPDRHGVRAETMDEDLQLLRTDSSQLLRQVEAKNRELEARINVMYEEFLTMRSENRDLKSQVQNLQQQFDRAASQDGEGKLSTERITQDVPRQVHKFEQHPREVQRTNPDIDKLVLDFEERCELVESNNQDLTERLDSCQQKFVKMQLKNEGFENQLTNIQQCLNKFEIHDETIPTQQRAKDTTHQNIIMTDKAKLNDHMNTPKEQVYEKNDGCSLIEKTLCTPCENRILLSTDEIQYGVFDVCDKYNVVLMKEKDKLKLFNHQTQIDVRPWGELGHANFATCIHWCSFLDNFLILYRYGLYTLSIKQNPKTSQMEFDSLNHISSIRVFSLKYDTTNRLNKALELLRFITTSANLSGYLYLNRGYRRLELVNTNSWKVLRGWSKQDLDYGERDEIRLITCSYDGCYLAMNIKWNDCVRFVDLRRHDDQMTLMKRIRAPNDSLSLHHRLQFPFDQEKWLLVADEKSQCYTVSTNPNDEKIIPMRTDHVQTIENMTVHLRFVRNQKYLLTGTVIGNKREKQGMFSFYKLSL